MSFKSGTPDLLFDFGLERDWTLQESHYLPPELIARMGQLGLGMTFSSIQLPRASGASG